MGIPVLLAATATKWASPARLPYELGRAGFDVALIAPKEALVAQSRFVAKFTPLPASATPRDNGHACSRLPSRPAVRD